MQSGMRNHWLRKIGHSSDRTCGRFVDYVWGASIHAAREATVTRADMLQPFVSSTVDRVGDAGCEACSPSNDSGRGIRLTVRPARHVGADGGWGMA